MDMPNASPGDGAVGTSLGLISSHMQSGNPAAAALLAERFVAAHPDHLGGLFLLGCASLELKKFAYALEIAEKAVRLAPAHPLAKLLRIDSLLGCGKYASALESAKALERDWEGDPAINLQIGNVYARANRYDDALPCYQRVRRLDPDNIVAVYNVSSAYTALSEIDKAVAELDELLRRHPHEYRACYTRATLRKWSSANNHVNELEAALRGVPAGGPAEPLLCYALAKELEDLGEWARSFAYLKRGAASRRHSLRYDVNVDIAMMSEVAATFDADFISEERSAYIYGDPIFILGMPRSGTTLVDRILSSHSSVRSIGESKEFGRAIERCSRTGTKTTQSSVQMAKSLAADSIGQEYCRSVEELFPGEQRPLDKTPRNFLYLGLIAKALPRAKIIHLRREPMDACYAIYKTLFTEGFEFSYSLEDLGRYYIAYLRLMDHWRSRFPSAFLDVSYEELVTNQEAVTRRMVSFCGLEWEDACLAFEKNTTPSLTASAAGVRQPLYKTSIGLWRRYEEELAPLLRIFEEGGVQIS
jgi:Sulfotransferase family/Tetratricopeptide repeat